MTVADLTAFDCFVSEFNPGDMIAIPAGYLVGTIVTGGVCPCWIRHGILQETDQTKSKTVLMTSYLFFLLGPTPIMKLLSFCFEHFRPLVFVCLENPTPEYEHTEANTIKIT